MGPGATAAGETAVAPTAPEKKPAASPAGLGHAGLRRAWLPLLILVVVAIAAFGCTGCTGCSARPNSPGRAAGWPMTQTVQPQDGDLRDLRPARRGGHDQLPGSGRPAADRPRCPAAWSLTLTTTAPAASANIVAQGDTDTIACRITVNGELKDEDLDRRETRRHSAWSNPHDHPVQGERPQTDEHGKRPHLAHWIRWLSVPIILGWLALTVVTNTLVPQIEVVGQAQSVPMAAADAPSTVAMNQIGRTFQEFKSNTSVMIVLEGDRPRGGGAPVLQRDRQEAHRRPQARRARPGLLERPADRSGLAERGRQGGLRPGVPGGQHGRGAGQRIGRGRQEVVASVPAAGIQAYVTGPSALINDTHYRR